MDTSVVCGIDPGITGGIAFYYPSGNVVAYDIPTAGGEVDADAVCSLLEVFQIRFTVIERASAMPKQGVSSTFKFGCAYGMLRASLASGKVPTHIVSAQKWKKHFGLNSDKEKSRALAIRLWPGTSLFSRKKDHGLAEAALLARYGAEVIERNGREA